MKINGEPVAQTKNPAPFPNFTIYSVTLRNGPCAGRKTLAGNTTTVVVQGHRYELNSAGDFVYAPEGLS